MLQADVRRRIHALSVDELRAALLAEQYTCVQVLHAYQEAALKVSHTCAPASWH